MKQRQSIFSFLAVITLLSTGTPAYAMEEALDLFRVRTPIKLTLEETIPDGPKKADICAFLKAVTLENVKTDAEPGVKKDVGFSFATTAPWCLLAAKYIQSLDRRPNLGDWGCGHGFFSRHAVLSGANPYAIDSSLAAANEANKRIFESKAYLAKGLKIQDLYKASNASVTNPGDKFMARQNDINVAFNVLHYLCPRDADLFLKKLYENTKDNGIVILSCDTPRNPNHTSTDFYEGNVAKGLKYPGYGVYSTSSISFKDTLSKTSTLERHVEAITPAEEEAQKFKMGEQYKGLYPLPPEQDYDNGQTIMVNEDFPDGDILRDIRRPYYYATGHQTKNKFAYGALKNVLELEGFTVLNGWYTDQTVDTLYPFDTEDLKIWGSKVVVVAQKRVPEPVT